MSFEGLLFKSLENSIKNPELTFTNMFKQLLIFTFFIKIGLFKKDSTPLLRKLVVYKDITIDLEMNI